MNDYGTHVVTGRKIAKKSFIRRNVLYSCTCPILYRVTAELSGKFESIKCNTYIILPDRKISKPSTREATFGGRQYYLIAKHRVLPAQNLCCEK